ncbi:GlgC family sugar phosphate nucleotidyltransferase [Thermospira aquatica]|uniref:Glucose-1-phosphate adenylyltransferase/Bifunctional protein GlmU-like C-terminal hexapeptide domain-containing protein n=1 Tax=Thermospira aquatica TaxID=2828656 RepID=A0AAX3BBG2_9SPIR|nr:hypothetical protein [Thermospira aquatica]URA09436.1 hypothetical protein KDW03_08035 [Thermospira aquatica]
MQEKLCDLAIIIGKQNKELLSLDIYTQDYLLPFTPRVRTIDFVVSSLLNGNIQPLIIITPDDADLIHNYLMTGYPENEIYVFNRQQLEIEFLPFLEELKKDHTIKTIGIFYGHFPNWFLMPQEKSLPNYALLLHETPLNTFPLGVILPLRAFEDSLRATAQTNLYNFLEGIIDTLSKEKRMHFIKLKGYFRPNYTLEDYYRIHLDLLDDYYFLDHINSLVPVKPFTRPNVFSKTYRSSHVINSLVGEDVHIYGHVENSIIFSHVIIEKKAFIKNAIILPRNHIASEAHIVNTIIDEFSLDNVNPNIGAKSRIGNESPSQTNLLFPMINGFTLIGKDTILPDKTIIGGNCYVESFLPPSVFKKHHHIKDGECVLLEEKT